MFTLRRYVRTDHAGAGSGNNGGRFKVLIFLKVDRGIGSRNDEGNLKVGSMENYEERRGNFHISTAQDKLDIDAIHVFLNRVYWSEGISKDRVATAIANSLCFGIYDSATQVGFARVITDAATFAYLCDVYVLDAYRGRGLSRWMMEAICAHPSLQNLRRFSLVTRDAHGLYAKFGFTPLQNASGHMEILRQDIYKTMAV
jgi:GNAT superfamily N-acetyltransferase